MIDELLSKSEMRMLMDDIEDDYNRIGENNVQQLFEPLGVVGAATNAGRTEYNGGKQVFSGGKPAFSGGKEPCREGGNVACNGGPAELYVGDTDPSRGNEQAQRKPQRKKQKKMCDSTIENGIPAEMDDLPCLDQFPGQFNFQLHLPSDCAHRWTFSRILNKVFIDIDKVLALQFKWNFHELKPDVQLYVRALPVYLSSDNMKVPVQRCAIHVLPDNILNTNFEYVQHVLRCEHTGTLYDCHPTNKRLSCVTPLSYPQPGSDSTTLTYKFVCKTSCPSGMDRKSIAVIFTLEDANGVVFGRQHLAVKICSCPKRDKQKEEKNEQQRAQSPSRRTPKSTGSGASTPTLSVKSIRGPSTSSAECIRDIQSSEPRAAGQDTSHSESESTTNQPVPKLSLGKVKRPREEDTSSFTELCDTVKELKETLHHLQRKWQARQDEDEYDLFARSVAVQLRGMPPIIANVLQLEIQQLVISKRHQIKSRTQLPNSGSVGGISRATSYCRERVPVPYTGDTVQA